MEQTFAEARWINQIFKQFDRKFSVGSEAEKETPLLLSLVGYLEQFPEVVSVVTDKSVLFQCLDHLTGNMQDD